MTMLASCRRTTFAGALLVTATLTRGASAALVCDGGAICADQDKDGFTACGCPWSGTPCDCDDGDPLRFPGAPERCDSVRDESCSGAADGCPDETGCIDGVCVPRCIPQDDFGCAPDSNFYHPNDDPNVCLCKPNDCSVFGCPTGATCDDDKTCVPNCTAAVRCPFGQVCRGVGCVDPCAEVVCPEGAVCDRGHCLPSCTCDPAGCPSGTKCDVEAPTPSCVEPACIGVRCEPGTHCRAGRCLPDCEGVVCPVKRVCRIASLDGGTRAECADLCHPDPCPLGDVCEWRTGTCKKLPPIEGGLIMPVDLGEDLDVAGAGGWFCTTSGLARGSALTLLATASTFLALFVRRRRRAGAKPTSERSRP